METKKWIVEPMHSEVEFTVRHMMISNVTGQFKKFDATVETQGDDLTTAKVLFTADVDSIDTNNEQRDTHLKSADFFDVINHPQLKFESTKLEKAVNDKYRLQGALTMHGVTHPVSLNVDYGGTIKDPWGNTRAGFTIEGKLNRKDYGLNWSALTETGGLVAGDEVKLHANVEFLLSRERGNESGDAERLAEAA